MIDMGKIPGENYWDNWYKKPTATGGQSSVTKPPNEQTSPLSPAAPAAAQGGAAMPAQQFTNYPSQWGTASNTYTDIANANPNSWGDWYDKAKQTTQYDITDAIRQAVETAGMGGMRYSSSLGRTGQDIAARAMSGLGAQYAQNEMNGYQQNQQNRLAASQGLGTLGQQYAYLPMDVSNNLMNQGVQMQNAYNQQISPYYNMWNSQQDYNSPWLQNNMQLAQYSNPATYDPSFITQFLDSIIPF